MPNHIITGLGGLDSQYSWISENVEEVLGLTAGQILEHRPTIAPLTLGYEQILAEEKQRRGPRLTFRSWHIEVEMVPLAVIALFLRDGDGELDKVVGAAWNCQEFCPTCSQMFPAPADLCRATFDLTRTASASL